ncbi:MAG TPA: hypothetical protein VJA21_33690 [Verrucomicrobiae bacterium]
MRFSPKEAESRREFFRATARYSLLGAIAVAATVLGKRRLGSQDCINRGICSSCTVFESCGLPQALSAKQARAGG